MNISDLSKSCARFREIETFFPGRNLPSDTDGYPISEGTSHTYNIVKRAVLHHTFLDI